MALSPKMGAAVAGCFLMIAAYAPAWAGSADRATTNATVAGEPSLLATIYPLVNVSVQHTAQKPCTPDKLYSSHDVVGDPDSCFMSKVDVRGSSVGPGGFSGAL
jgi:hypothetical protein